MALAVQADPAAYISVTVTPPFFQQVQQGIAGHISGFEARDIAGVFPLARLDSAGDDSHWQQWAEPCRERGRFGGAGAPGILNS